MSHGNQAAPVGADTATGSMRSCRICLARTRACAMTIDQLVSARARQTVNCAEPTLGDPDVHPLNAIGQDCGESAIARQPAGCSVRIEVSELERVSARGRIPPQVARAHDQPRRSGLGPRDPRLRHRKKPQNTASSACRLIQVVCAAGPPNIGRVAAPTEPKRLRR